MPKHSQQLFALIAPQQEAALEKFLEEQKAEIGLKALTEMIQCADEEGNTALHKAAKQTDCSFLSALLYSDVNIALPNKQGDTPLHIAIDTGHISNLKILLARDNDKIQLINKINLKKETPLQRAIATKKLEVILFLLSYFPSLNCQQAKKDLGHAFKHKQLTEQDLPPIIETCQKELTRLEKLRHPDPEDKKVMDNLRSLIKKISKFSSKPTGDSGFGLSKFFNRPNQTPVAAASPSASSPYKPTP